MHNTYQVQQLLSDMRIGMTPGDTATCDIYASVGEQMNENVQSFERDGRPE